MVRSAEIPKSRVMFLSPSVFILHFFPSEAKKLFPITPLRPQCLTLNPNFLSIDCACCFSVKNRQRSRQSVFVLVVCTNLGVILDLQFFFQGNETLSFPLLRILSHQQFQRFVVLALSVLRSGQPSTGIHRSTSLRLKASFGMRPVSCLYVQPKRC